MATATIVDAFCDPIRANAANMNPMNKLPESPRKMLAGKKLNRKKPRVAPASVIARSATSGFGTTSDTIKTAKVLKNADPAASPSRPSIRLKAFVINKTQMMVKGRQ